MKEQSPFLFVTLRSIISATHDMKMLDASDRVLWLEDGAISRIQSRSELKVQIGSINGKEV